VEENTWHVNVVLELGKFDHLVPLTRQSKALFERLRHLHPQYVVPGRRHGQRISEATLNAALHALGFKDKHCTHGFRTSASTLLGEMGWDRALIERQLSHQLMDRVEAAYNKGKFLPQRKRMLQCWSDYLDALIDQTTGAENQQPDEWYQQWSLTNSA
jgi:integrase